jgi:K+-sensing histidine kinase KdpD
MMGSVEEEAHRAVPDLPLVPWGMTVVLASMAGATIVRWLLGPLVENGLPFVLYLASVAVSTYWAGWRAGIVATAVSVLAGSYFFADPAGSFGIHGPQDIVSPWCSSLLRPWSSRR